MAHSVSCGSAEEPFSVLLMDEEFWDHTSMNVNDETVAVERKDEADLPLVPSLRFPEFQGAEGWKEKFLGNEGDFLSSLTGKAGGDFDVGEARFVTYMNVFSNTFVDPKALRLVDVREGEKQNAVACGDVFFTISSETPEEVGMSSVLLEDLENCYLNSFCALFRFSKSKRPDPVFVGYMLRQPLVRGYLTKKAQGSTRFNLSKDAFRSLPLFLPSPAEQQKIANCLSSLDDLITLEAQKLDGLKAHKKGLMQQLFPREGETQPRLRFPEFQNAGEWVLKKLEEVSPSVFDGTHQTPTYTPEGVPFYSVENLISGNANKFISRDDYLLATKKNRAEKGDILITRIGKIGYSQLVTWDHDFSVYVTLAVIKKSKAFNSHFLSHFMQSDFYQSELRARSLPNAVPPKINLDSLRSTEVLLPNDAEQQRIASCLTSLDDLITAQTQKLEALKTHKNGLMQQLFPQAPEE